MVCFLSLSEGISFAVSREFYLEVLAEESPMLENTRQISLLFLKTFSLEKKKSSEKREEYSFISLATRDHTSHLSSLLSRSSFREAGLLF